MNPKQLPVYNSIAYAESNKSILETKVGTVLVKDENILGYGNTTASSPNYVCDAVMNAVVNTSRSLEGATLIINRFPSREEALIIGELDLANVYITDHSLFGRFTSFGVAGEILHMHYPFHRFERNDGQQTYLVYRKNK